MRRDVHNVMAERPKSGRTWLSKSARKKQVLLDSEGLHLELTRRETMPKRQKMRNTRLNVLERFLVSRVGCPWDKVYSEVCQVADLRSFRGEEVRDYLRLLVHIDCWMERRKVMTLGADAMAEPVKGLFVNPRNGLIARR